MAPEENAAPEVATEVSEEEAAEVAAALDSGEESATEEDHEPTEEDHEPTQEELYEQAQELDIKGRSKMDKSELAAAVAAAVAPMKVRRLMVMGPSPQVVHATIFPCGSGLPAASRIAAPRPLPQARIAAGRPLLQRH